MFDNNYTFVFYSPGNNSNKNYSKKDIYFDWFWWVFDTKTGNFLFSFFSLSPRLFEGRFHSFMQRCSILSCKVSYVLWTDRRCSREWHWQIKEEGEVRLVTNPYGDSRSPDGISGLYHQLHFSNYHTQYQSIFCKIKPIFLFSFLRNHSLSGVLNCVRIDFMFYNHVTFLHAYRIGSEVIFLGYL